jgi:hypothetical protein
MFLLSLECCHYSLATLNWYEANRVTAVPKNLNPKKWSEFRQIFKYWSIDNGNLMKTLAVISNDKAKLDQCLKIAENVNRSCVQALMGAIKGKVRDFIQSSKILP